MSFRLDCVSLTTYHRKAVKNSFEINIGGIEGLTISKAMLIPIDHKK